MRFGGAGLERAKLVHDCSGKIKIDWMHMEYAERCDCYVVQDPRPTSHRILENVSGSCKASVTYEPNQRQTGMASISRPRWGSLCSLLLLQKPRTSFRDRLM